MQFEFGFEGKPDDDSAPTPAPAPVRAVGADLRVGDLVVFTYLTGRPKPHVGYVCERKESRRPRTTSTSTSYVTHVFEEDKAKVKIVPLNKLLGGKWGRCGRIVTRIEEECFRIPDKLSDVELHESLC